MVSYTAVICQLLSVLPSKHHKRCVKFVALEAKMFKTLKRTRQLGADKLGVKKNYDIFFAHAVYTALRFSGFLNFGLHRTLHRTANKQTPSNKHMHYKSWSSKGVRNVGHLMKESMHFVSFEDFTERINFLTFQGVISAIKALRKSNEENLHNITTKYETVTDTFLKARQPNRQYIKFSLAKSRKNRSKLKKNGSRIAESKPKKTLIGKQFTDHLSCTQRSQN